VDVEADLLRVRRPVLVAEAVLEFTVMGRGERVVAGADRALVDLECVGRVLDLCWSCPSAYALFIYRKHCLI
jgi:hypothetical protein